MDKPECCGRVVSHEVPLGTRKKHDVWFCVGCKKIIGLGPKRLPDDKNFTKKEMRTIYKKRNHA